MKTLAQLAFILATSVFLISCGDDGEGFNGISDCDAGHEIRTSVGTIDAYMELFLYDQVLEDATLGQDLSSQLDEAIKDQNPKLAKEINETYCENLYTDQNDEDLSQEDKRIVASGYRKCLSEEYDSNYPVPEYKAEIFDYAAMRVQVLLESEFNAESDVCIGGYENQVQPDGTSKPVWNDCKETQTQSGIKPGYETAVELKQGFIELRDKLRNGDTITRAQAEEIRRLIAELKEKGSTTYEAVACSVDDWFARLNKGEMNSPNFDQEFNIETIERGNEDYRRSNPTIVQDSPTAVNV